MENVNDELRIKNTELQAEVNKWKHNSQYFADESAERLSKITELQAQLAEAKVEAESLAMTMWKQHYKSISPGWGLCDSVAGVISQIDNMVAGLVERKALDAEILRCTKEYAHWHTYAYSEIDDKDLAYDNLLEAVKAREEANG